ncbi:MAG: TIGR00282 family metallophosphoesterase [Chloroflexota bacterium]|nr:TIGR00282 family metallophosphoesterase [Chloroflexota bacterium]
MRLLMVGDVVGKPGRRAVRALLPALRDEYRVDYVVANGENSAGGFGVTLETAAELLDCGVDVLTTGNHVWDQKEIVPYLDQEIPILRPMNYPNGVPGRGYTTIRDLTVVNLMGRVFMATLECPFRTMDAFLLKLNGKKPGVIVVDFHAEATSEKQAIGWYLDGRVSVVVGTHTHVPTADARILPKGTAFVTDLGMVGPLNSIIGNDPAPVMERFLTMMPRRLTVPSGPVSFNSVLVEVGPDGRATSIERLDRVVE